MKKLISFLVLFLPAISFAQNHIYSLKYDTVIITGPGNLRVDGKSIFKGKTTYSAGRPKIALELAYWQKIDSLYQPLLGYTPANDANVVHNNLTNTPENKRISLSDSIKTTTVMQANQVRIDSFIVNNPIGMAQPNARWVMHITKPRNSIAGVNGSPMFSHINQTGTEANYFFFGGASQFSILGGYDGLGISGAVQDHAQISIGDRHKTDSPHYFGFYSDGGYSYEAFGNNAANLFNSSNYPGTTYSLVRKDSLGNITDLVQTATHTFNGMIAYGAAKGIYTQLSPMPKQRTDSVYQASLGFTPENVANKVTTLSSPNNTTYPTSLAVSNAIAAIPTGGVSSFNTRTGAVVSISGDYNTSQVTENTGFKYFTEPRVLATLLTGYAPLAGTITNASSIIDAINKLSGNIAAVPTPTLQSVTSKDSVTTHRIVASSYRAGGYNTNLYTDLIIFNGNSITFGKNALPASVYSYVPMTASRLETNYYNYGISGTTLVQHSTGDSSAIERISTITKPAYVSTTRAWVSMYGVNDANNVGGTLDTAVFRASYYRILDTLTIARGYPQNKIYIGIPFNNNANNVLLNTLIRNIALVKGVNFMAVRDSMVANGGTSLIDADGIHPLNAGHDVIARCISATISGTKYNYTIINHDILSPGKIVVGRGIYGGDVSNGLQVGGTMGNTGSSKVTILDPLWINKNIIISGNAGAASKPQYIQFPQQYIAGRATGSNLQIATFSNTGITTSNTDGLTLISAAGSGSRITSLNKHFFTNGIGLLENGFIDYGNGSTGFHTGTSTYATSFIRFFGTTSIDVTNTQGLVLSSNAGSSTNISLIGNTLVTGTLSATSNLAIGTLISGSSTTPATITTGSSFSSVAGANPKLNLGNSYGMGVSSGSLDYIAPTSGRHSFYINGVEQWRISPLGNWSNIGNGSAAITLKAGTATAGTAPIKFTLTSASVLTTQEAGAFEVDANANAYLTNASLVRNQFAFINNTALTGTPTAPTPVPGTNTTQIPTTAFVQGAIGVTPYKPITANYTVLSTDRVLFVNATSGNITITITPSTLVYATGITSNLQIKRIDASVNTVTITTTSGFIGYTGNTSVTLTAGTVSTEGQGRTLLTDGTNIYNN